MEYIRKLHGIGPVQATKIFKLLVSKGLIIKGESYTQTDIRKLLKTPEIHDLLPVSAQSDLKFNPNEEIPREIVGIADKELQNRIVGIKFKIAGSYRRLRPICHDIDIVVSRGRCKKFEPIWQKMLAALEQSQIIKFELPYAQGQGKVATFINIIDADGKKWVVKVDIFITPPNEYPFMLLYATGSGLFNIRMRALAKHNGYLLNQKGIFKKENGQLKVANISNEKDVFELLNMTYKEPQDRIK